MRPFPTKMLLLLTLLGLGGCATATEPGSLLWVRVRGENPCVVQVARSRYAVPGDESRLRSRFRREARVAGAVLFDFGSKEPEVGCWASVMSLARAAEFNRIGFLDPEEKAEEAEAPPQ